MNTLKLLNKIRLDGGISANLVTGEINPTQGYMVSLGTQEETHLFIDEDILEKFVTKNKTELMKPNRFLGVWFDGDVWYVEVSEQIGTKRDAYFWALVRNQQAFWDCANSDEIYISKRHSIHEEENE